MGGSFLSGPSKPAGTKKKQNKKLFVGLKQELNIKHAREKRKKGGGRGESFSQRSRERQGKCFPKSRDGKNDRRKGGRRAAHAAPRCLSGPSGPSVTQRWSYQSSGSGSKFQIRLRRPFPKCSKQMLPIPPATFGRCLHSH